MPNVSFEDLKGFVKDIKSGQVDSFVEWIISADINRLNSLLDMDFVQLNSKKNLLTFLIEEERYDLVHLIFDKLRIEDKSNVSKYLKDFPSVIEKAIKSVVTRDNLLYSLCAVADLNKEIIFKYAKGISSKGSPFLVTEELNLNYDHHNHDQYSKGSGLNPLAYATLNGKVEFVNEVIDSLSLYEKEALSRKRFNLQLIQNLSHIRRLDFLATHVKQLRYLLKLDIHRAFRIENDFTGDLSCVSLAILSGCNEMLKVILNRVDRAFNPENKANAFFAALSPSLEVPSSKQLDLTVNRDNLGEQPAWIQGRYVAKKYELELNEGYPVMDDDDRRMYIDVLSDSNNSKLNDYLETTDDRLEKFLGIFNITWSAKGFKDENGDNLKSLQNKIEDLNKKVPAITALTFIKNEMKGYSKIDSRYFLQETNLKSDAAKQFQKDLRGIADRPKQNALYKYVMEQYQESNTSLGDCYKRYYRAELEQLEELEKSRQVLSKKINSFRSYLKTEVLASDRGLLYTKLLNDGLDTNLAFSRILMCSEGWDESFEDGVMTLSPNVTFQTTLKQLATDLTGESSLLQEIDLGKAFSASRDKMKLSAADQSIMPIAVALMSQNQERLHEAVKCVDSWSSENFKASLRSGGVTLFASCLGSVSYKEEHMKSIANQVIEDYKRQVENGYANFPSYFKDLCPGSSEKVKWKLLPYLKDIDRDLCNELMDQEEQTHLEYLDSSKTDPRGWMKLIAKPVRYGGIAFASLLNLHDTKGDEKDANEHIAKLFPSDTDDARRDILANIVHMLRYVQADRKWSVYQLLLKKFPNHANDVKTAFCQEVNMARDVIQRELNDRRKKLNYEFDEVLVQAILYPHRYDSACVIDLLNKAKLPSDHQLVEMVIDKIDPDHPYYEQFKKKCHEWGVVSVIGYAATHRVSLLDGLDLEKSISAFTRYQLDWKEFFCQDLSAAEYHTIMSLIRMKAPRAVKDNDAADILKRLINDHRICNDSLGSLFKFLMRNENFKLAKTLAQKLEINIYSDALDAEQNTFMHCVAKCQCFNDYLNLVKDVGEQDVKVNVHGQSSIQLLQLKQMEDSDIQALLNGLVLNGRSMSKELSQFVKCLEKAESTAIAKMEKTDAQAIMKSAFDLGNFEAIQYLAAQGLNDIRYKDFIDFYKDYRPHKANKARYKLFWSVCRSLYWPIMVREHKKVFALSGTLATLIGGGLSLTLSTFVPLGVMVGFVFSMSAVLNLADSRFRDIYFRIQSLDMLKNNVSLNQNSLPYVKASRFCDEMMVSSRNVRDSVNDTEPMRSSLRYD